MWNLEKKTYLYTKLIDIENKLMVTKGEMDEGGTN